jgi:hypothetical protein
MSRIPIIVRVDIPGVTDAGEVDAEVYCVNDTGEPFSIRVRSNSFTTVDEDAGTVVRHGSDPVERSLAPGAAVRIAAVRGWEWDGHVGVEVEYRGERGGGWERRTYGLKRSGERFRIDAVAREGCIVPAEIHFR